MVKVILVTGANKGIGLAIVEALLKEVPDSLLLLGSRDATRGQDAVSSVLSKMGDGVRERLRLLLIDVTSDSSVEAALAKVQQEHGTLHGLVNNAGGGIGGSARDTVELNLYGVRRVCEAFAPVIEEGGRIVQVSSGSAPMFVEKCGEEMKQLFVNKDITWQELEEKMIRPFLEIAETGAEPSVLEARGFGSRNEGSMGAYGLSKAGVNCYTMELARRFPALTITSCSPGFIETDLTRDFFTKEGKTPAEMGMLTVEQGARCPVFLMTEDLASLPDFTSGWYFGSDCQRSPLHKYRSPGTPAYEGEFP